MMHEAIIGECFMIINKVIEFDRLLKSLCHPFFEIYDRSKGMRKLLSVSVGTIPGIFLNYYLYDQTSLHNNIIMATSILTAILSMIICYKLMILDLKIHQKKIDKCYREISTFLEENEKEIVQYIHKNYINKEDVIYKINFPELKLSFMNKEYEKTLQIILLLDNVIKENAPISDKYTLEEQIKLSQYDTLMKVEENVEKEINHKYQL